MNRSGKETTYPKHGMLSWAYMDRQNKAWFINISHEGDLMNLRSFGLFGPAIVGQLHLVGITRVAVGYHDKGTSFYIQGPGPEFGSNILQLLKQYYGTHPKIGEISWQFLSPA